MYNNNSRPDVEKCVCFGAKRDMPLLSSRGTDVSAKGHANIFFVLLPRILPRY